MRFSSRMLARTWCVVLFVLVLGVMAMEATAAGGGGDKGTVPPGIPKPRQGGVPGSG